MILVLILVLLLCLGGLPTWNLHPYGYYPSSVGVLLLVIVLVLVLTGYW